MPQESARVALYSDKNHVLVVPSTSVQRHILDSLCAMHPGFGNKVHEPSVRIGTVVQLGLPLGLSQFILLFSQRAARCDLGIALDMHLSQ